MMTTLQQLEVLDVDEIRKKYLFYIDNTRKYIEKEKNIVDIMIHAMNLNYVITEEVKSTLK